LKRLTSKKPGGENRKKEASPAGAFRGVSKKKEGTLPLAEDRGEKNRGDGCASGVRPKITQKNGHKKKKKPNKRTQFNAEKMAKSKAIWADPPE